MRVGLWLVWLAGCASGTDGTTTDDTTETTVPEPPCVALNPGDWVFKGECPQMRTPLVMTVDACEITLDYSGTGMTMGMPFAGTVDGDQITFDDGDGVTGCVGTVEAADSVTGTCDGCTFSLVQ